MRREGAQADGDQETWGEWEALCGKYNRLMGSGDRNLGLGSLDGVVREASLRKRYLTRDLMMVRSQLGEDWRAGNTINKGSKVRGFERTKCAMSQEHVVGDA